MPSELVIQLQQIDGLFSCEQYSHFPASYPTFVAICYVDNLASRQMAINLKRLLINEIKSVHPTFNSSEPPCGGSHRLFGSCKALEIPDNRKMLIVVSDGQSFTFQNQDVLQWNYDTLPVVPANVTVAFPSPFDTPQVCFVNTVADAIPDIFVQLGITTEDHKVFISYRRTERSMLAEQLFDELNRMNFDVFLDRFTINPGINFQNRLYQELADKSMVIFLESPDFENSNWLQLEVAFAKVNRLGYLAINVDDAPKLSFIDDENRISFAPAQMVGDELNIQALETAARKIKKQHGLSILRRRNTLTTSLQNGFSIHNVAIESHRGFLKVTNNMNQRCFMIWPTSRPPQVSDYKNCHSSCTNGETKIVFGPAFMEQKRKELNEWLSIVASTQFYNEGQIFELINSII